MTFAGAFLQMLLTFDQTKRGRGFRAMTTPVIQFLTAAG
jgi:hypothetical protein